MHWVSTAAWRAFRRAGISIAISSAMMPMTTRSSTRVNPLLRRTRMTNVSNLVVPAEVDVLVQERGVQPVLEAGVAVGDVRVAVDLKTIDVTVGEGNHGALAVAVVDHAGVAAAGRGATGVVVVELLPAGSLG